MSSSVSSPSISLGYNNNDINSAAGGSIFILFATVAVALRFWARQLSKVPFGLDDYLVLAALIVHHAFAAVAISAVFDGGLGRDYQLVQAEGLGTIVFLFKALFASQLLYGLSSSLVKLAVLALLWRIFPTRRVKVGCIILGALSIAWAIAVLIVAVLQCRPLRAFWYLELQARPGTHCLDFVLFYFAAAVANSIIDFAILALPILEILKLQISRPRKIGICAVFLLGSIASTASLLRAVSLGVVFKQGPTNFTKQSLLPYVAAVIETYAGIISACLPLLVPVYRRLRYGDATKSGSRTSADNPGKRTVRPKRYRPFFNQNGLGVDQVSFERLYGDDGSSARSATLTANYRVEAKGWVRHDPANGKGTDVPLRGIMVRQDIELSTRGRDGDNCIS